MRGTPVAVHVGPDDRWAITIRLSNNCRVRHVDPFAVQQHAVMAVLRVPLNVADGKTVSEGAALPVAICQIVKPVLKRIIDITAIVSAKAEPIFPPIESGR